MQYCDDHAPVLQRSAFIVQPFGMPAGTITALRVQERDSQRVNVFVDGAFALGVSLATLTRERLFVGQQLSEEEFARLERTESADKATHAGMRLIETRPRSLAELRDRLQRKGFAPEAVENALERLSDLGLADDAAFARFWVENRQSYRPRGVNALRAELRRKGVAQDVIGAAIDESGGREEEAERAMELGRAAVHKYADAPDYHSFSRRLGGYLQRRGFGFDTVRPVLEHLWREQHGRDEE
jgi:regulatory protein